MYEYNSVISGAHDRDIRFVTTGVCGTIAVLFAVICIYTFEVMGRVLGRDEEEQRIIPCVPLATEPGISLIMLPLMFRVATIRRTTDTFLFISHTTNVLLFKFRCNIFIGVRIIKEMPGSLASGTHRSYCTTIYSKIL